MNIRPKEYRCASCGRNLLENDEPFATYPLLRRELDRLDADTVIWETPETCARAKCVERLMLDPSWTRRDLATERAEWDERIARGNAQNAVLQPLRDARQLANQKAWDELHAAEEALEAALPKKSGDWYLIDGAEFLLMKAVKRFFNARRATTWSDEQKAREDAEDAAALKAAGLEPS